MNYISNKIKNNKRAREIDYFSEENDFLNFASAYKKYTKSTTTDLNSSSTICFLTGFYINKAVFGDVKQYFNKQSFILENTQSGDDNECISLRVMTTRDPKYLESIKKRSEDEIEKRVIDVSKIMRRLNVHNSEYKENFIEIIEIAWSCFINIISFEEARYNNNIPSIVIEVKYVFLDEIISFANSDIYDFRIFTRKGKGILIEISIKK